MVHRGRQQCPGWGGKRQCMAESPASTGNPTSMGGRPLRRAASTTMGISRTSPTSKKTGMPTRIPSASSAQGSPLGPHPSTKSSAQRSCRAGTGQKLPENRPHAQNDGDMSHHFAGSGGEREGNLFQGNARERAQRQGSHGQAQRGVQPQPSHQKQQERDGASHTGQQVSVMSGGMGGRKGRVHGPIIPAASAIQAADCPELRPSLR